MQASDSAPEKGPICAHIACPLIREALFNARKFDCMLPDLSNRQLGPIGNMDFLWDLSLKLHDLVCSQELLHEVQSAIRFARQKEELDNTRIR